MTLLDSLNLTQRLSDFDVFPFEVLKSDINYVDVKKKIEDLRANSVKFIYDSFNNL